MMIHHDGVAARTEKAVLLKFGDDKIWVPLSLIDGNEVDGDDAGEVEVPGWFARKEGLDEYSDE